MRAGIRGETPQRGNESAGPQGAAAWLREHRVTVAASILLALQLLWMATLLTRCYFIQDDYFYLDQALTHSLNWSYLMTVQDGHLKPVTFAIAWLMARISLYNWTLTWVFILALLAAAGLALLRMLRTVFGERPAIFVLLAIYLLSPLTLAPVDWWTVALEILPLELAIFMAVDAHVRYLRGGRFRHALATAGWVVLGMAAMDKGAVLPALLFAVTSAFFVEGRWAAAMVIAARKYWRAWLLYGVLLAGYCVIFFIRLPAGATPHRIPVTALRVLSFLWTLVSDTMVPGVMGGPWRWLPLADGSVFPVPPPPLVQLAGGIALVIIIVSCIYRVGAWRAWAIMAGWIAVADVVPVVLGRLGVAAAGLLGLQQRYATDAVPMLALCLGLAFVPVSGGAGRYRFRQPAATAAGPSAAAVRAVGITVRIGSVMLAAAFLAGSVVSLLALQSATRTQSVRSYVATAGVAVAQAPRRTLIIDVPTPSFIMNPVFFNPTGYTSSVIGVLDGGAPARRFTWARSPRGVLRDVMMFDSRGRLRPAAVVGLPSGPPPGRTCWDLAGGGIPLPRPLFRWGWTVRLDYSGPATVVAVSFGGNPVRAVLPAGDHSFYLPLTGSGREVGITPVGAPGPLCLTEVTVGTWQPMGSGRPIPAAPVAG